MTVDKGVTIRGKYTFPKMTAFETKVLEVAVRQEEKYVHIVMLDI